MKLRQGLSGSLKSQSLRARGRGKDEEKKKDAERMRGGANEGEKKKKKGKGQKHEGKNKTAAHCDTKRSKRKSPGNEKRKWIRERDNEDGRKGRKENEDCASTMKIHTRQQHHGKRAAKVPIPSSTR